MKVAIFLCGLSRSYEETYESFLNAYSGYDYDCFLHTWKLGSTSIKNGSNSGRLDLVSPDEKQLQTMFNVKKLKVEEQIVGDIPGLLRDSTTPYPNNAVCYHESIKRCMQLCDNPEQYDMCVVTRPDIFYFDKVTLPEVERDTICVPYINNLYEGKNIIQKMKSQNPNSINDMLYNCLAFGTYNDIKVFAEFADEYVDLCKNNKFFLTEGKIDYIPDRALAIYVKMIKGKKVLEMKMKHGIMRENKKVQMYSW